MRTKAAQFMNEIISLTVMLLMCVALVFGRVNAGSEHAADVRDDGALSLRIDVSFRHEGE